MLNIILQNPRLSTWCYPEHTVLQLDCTNTLNDQLHENVAAELVPPEGWDLVVEIICPRVEYNNGQVSPSST